MYYQKLTSKYTKFKKIELQGDTENLQLYWEIPSYLCKLSAGQADKKIHEDRKELNDAIKHYHITELAIRIYMFFSSTQGTFIKISHIIGYTIHPSKF